MVIFGFGGIKPLYKSTKFVLQPTNSLLYSHMVTHVHLGIWSQCSLVHIMWPLHVGKSPYYIHTIANVVGTFKQIIKLSIIINEVCTLMPIEVGVVDIMGKNLENPKSK